MCFHCTLLYPCFLPFLFLTMHFASWPKLNISISLSFPFNLKSEVLLFCFIIEKSLNHYFVIPVMFTCNFFLSSVFLLLFSLYLFSNVAYHLQALRGLYKGLEICYSLMFLWMDYVFVVIQLALFSVIFSQSLFHVFFFVTLTVRKKLCELGDELAYINFILFFIIISVYEIFTCFLFF